MSKATPWKPLTSQHQAATILRMCALANSYEESAEVLSGKLYPDHGKAVTLLEILALEIRLKCAVLVERNERPRSHSYNEIWQQLSEDTRREIIKDASDRMSVHADFSDLSIIFRHLECAFKKGRYEYEANDERTFSEAREIGNAWIENGAKDEDADFVYHPDERFGLSDALKKWLAQKCSAIEND